MNNYDEYLAKRRQDPEYRKVEKQLKPILDLADNVLRLRMERGWTQAELAKRVRTKQSNISRLENGLANSTFKFLQKLSEVFGVELAVYLGPQPAEVLLTDTANEQIAKSKQASPYRSPKEPVKPFQKDAFEQIRECLVVQTDSDLATERNWDTFVQPHSNLATRWVLDISAQPRPDLATKLIVDSSVQPPCVA